MPAFLRRRWFLLLLAGGLAVAAACPDCVRPIGDRLPLRLIVALSLFLTACSLEGRRLARALARPGGVLVALAISFAFLPALALLAGGLLPLDDLRLGLLIIACVPCTLSSAVLWTRHAGGDEALALLIVVTTNALGWLVAPLWLASAGSAVVLDPLAMMRSLVVVLVVPVALGQVLRFVPGVARVVDRHRTSIGVSARLLVATVLVCAAADGAAQTEWLTVAALLSTAAVTLGLHLAGVVLAFAGGWLLRLPRAERIAVAIAGSQKTLPVGLFLFGAYYRADYPLAVLPLLLYHAGQLLADTLLADKLAAGQGGTQP
jgi:sodium/bile acid cotransporter 7